MKMNYYNEWDAETAAWLRELIRQGYLPAGDVDERSITEVNPNEIRGYKQWHFFAGIGGWSLALRMAGWAEDRPVLTGSPPCQPFSNAGRKHGIADERHLAPVWLSLVAALRAPFVFGEQVAAAVTKDNWLDDLLNELEAEGYSTGAIVLPACSIGTPHIRQRIWFTGRMGYSDNQRPQGRTRMPQCSDKLIVGERRGVANGMDQSDSAGSQQGSTTTQTPRYGNTAQSTCGADGTYTQNSGWDNSDWVFCKDGRWRPIESIIEPRLDVLSDRLGYSRFGDRYTVNPLIKKTENRVMRLRGYGNAIVPSVAAQIIKAVM
jgi:DNA (cytosine-5)-methyltransferase 1